MSPINFGVGRARTIGPFYTDFTVSPTINGITEWSIARDGPIIMDGETQTTYTLVAQRSFSRTTKMWGQGSPGGNGGTGGYSTGTINFTSGTTYTIKLNTGGGSSRPGSGTGLNAGQPGGGYAGLFRTNTVSQANAIMMAGGGGGGAPSIGGAGLSGSGSTAGGGGGGSSGSNGGNSANTETGSTGGGGGTQSSGGSAGGGSGTAATAGSALQGGTGGQGSGSGPDPNWSGGGGGGGGYFGGGGGGGGNDNGNVTRAASGGGGGSGYINTSYVSGGSTGAFQDAPNRGSAGSVGGPARVVIE